MSDVVSQRENHRRVCRQRQDTKVEVAESARSSSAEEQQQEIYRAIPGRCRLNNHPYLFASMSQIDQICQISGDLFYVGNLPNAGLDAVIGK